MIENGRLLKPALMCLSRTEREKERKNGSYNQGSPEYLERRQQTLLSPIFWLLPQQRLTESGKFYINVCTMVLIKYPM